jgi:sugar transferase (PEP-CTERM/EpsH1 system associated)
MDKKNILFVSSELPYPPVTGSKIKVFNLVKSLSHRYNIILLSFIEEITERGNVSPLRKYCSQIETVLRPRGFSFFQRLTNLFSLTPVVIRKFSLNSMKEKILSLVRKYSPALIHFDSIYVSAYVRLIRGIPTIFHEHNIESRRYLRQIKVKKISFLKRVHLLLDYWKYRRYEFKICPRFTQCLVVSPEEQALLKKNSPKARVSLFPNGVDCNYFQSLKIKENETDEVTLVFTGSMSYYPNIDAMEYFCENVFPLIKEKLPNVKLYIVGSAPSPNIQRLAQKETIIVTGKVDDVRPYLAKATVCIVPLRIGGGTRIKILEAWASGKAVVSTPLGAEGLEGVRADENIIIAELPSQFAIRTIDVVRNSNLREKLATEGRKLALRKYDYQKILNRVSKIYQKYIH